MTYEDLMHEVTQLRVRTVELEHQLAISEAALRTKAARPAPKRRSADTKTDTQKEGARVIAKTRASIDAACRKGLRSCLANAPNQAGAISMYAEAMGISFESAKLRIKGQYAVLRAAGQPFNAQK